MIGSKRITISCGEDSFSKLLKDEDRHQIIRDFKQIYLNKIYCPDLVNGDEYEVRIGNRKLAEDSIVDIEISDKDVITFHKIDLLPQNQDNNQQHDNINLEDIQNHEQFEENVSDEQLQQIIHQLYPDIQKSIKQRILEEFKKSRFNASSQQVGTVVLATEKIIRIGQKLYGLAGNPTILQALGSFGKVTIGGTKIATQTFTKTLTSTTNLVGMAVCTAIDVGFLFYQYKQGTITGHTFFKRSGIKLVSNIVGTVGVAAGASVGSVIGAMIGGPGTIVLSLLGATIFGYLAQSRTNDYLDSILEKEIENTPSDRLPTTKAIYEDSLRKFNINHDQLNQLETQKKLLLRQLHPDKWIEANDQTKEQKRQEFNDILIAYEIIKNYNRP